MSIEWGLPAVWELLKGAVNLIKRTVKYAMSSKSFVIGLRDEVRNLENKVQTVEVLEDQTNNNVRNFADVLMTWHQRTDMALEEARELLDDFEKDSKTCCYGTLPSLYRHYKFSKEAEGKIEVIKNLAREASEFKVLDDVSCIGPAPGNVTALNLTRREVREVVQSTSATASLFSASTSIKLREAGIFESRALMIRYIMDALVNNSSSVVGVYGMGGVGKSTLLEEVEIILGEEKSFDWIAKADVSKNPDLKAIQGEIAKALRLTDIDNEETISGRAELLHSRLEDEERKKKKVLIMLDNLWKGLDLKSIGIACGLDEKVKGCQLLLTSRHRDVLQRQMGCDKVFPLGGLKEEEAKSLFERMVGDKIRDGEFKPRVEVAVDKCAGLPFLIVAMAKHLKGADLSECKDTLKKIEKFKDQEINNLRDQMLQWSYDKLEEEVKSLLQLCVAYGVSKPSLQNLMRYGIGLGLFKEVSSMKEVRNRLSSSIRTLQASSLLLDSEDVASFKIHDLVCEFVALFASSNQPLLVLKDKDKLITELPKDKLNSYRAICFPYVDMERLPQELDCSELQIFLLFTNNKYLHVPDSVFNSMRRLMVLNLTGIRLTRLPLPFQLLENLCTLCLDDCWLEDVYIVGMLKRLQILSFVGSKIRRLPKEIGQLGELRLLDLNCCSQLEIIEPGVLGNLINLEELFMENSFDEWNVGQQTSPTNASLIELNHMKNLHTLHVSVPNPSMLPGDLHVEKLTEFGIKIGNPWYQWSKYKGSRTLELQLGPISDVLWKGCIQNILCKTDVLLLDSLDGIEQTICALSQKGFPQLKHLYVQDSPFIRYILEWSSLPAFKKFETLTLNNLVNLEKICHNYISTMSFSTLRVVRVIRCDKMKVLFPCSLVRGLPHLEKIKVDSCNSMRGIVEADDCSRIELSKLRVLELHDLPNIKSFFTDGSASSRRTSDDQVGTQIAFFNGKQVSIPSLESLTMEGLPNLKELWSDESPLELSNLQSLEVVQCESLLKVISSKLLVKLHKLQTITIKDCVSVLEIFDLEGPSCGENVEIDFELTTFSLEGLQSLRSIWNKNPCGIVSFYNLKKLEVDDCNNLEFMFFRSMVKSLAPLRDLTIRHCKKMKAIFMEEEGLGLEKSETLAFPMLTNLHLEHLDSLTCFSHGKRSREALSQDCIQSCSIALFDREVSIPSLESLTMEGLPNLKEIWSDESLLEQSNLQSLVVVGSESLLKVINSRSLAKLPKLHTFSIKYCVSVQEIFDLEGLTDIGDVEPFFELTIFSLVGLWSLRHIWNKNPGGIVAFHNLKELEVYDCNNLEFMFFPSMVKSLVQLRCLTVRYCKRMEAIIMDEKGLALETSETPAFPMLTNLCLGYLESLTCFSHKKRSREARSHDLVQSRSVALFSREVSIPALESLTMDGLPNLKEIWSEESPLEQSNLQSLVVAGCDSLLKVISSKSLVKLQKLHTLTIKHCVSMEEIFDLEEPTSNGNVETQSELTNFSLVGLQRLRHIWNHNPCGIVSFHNLKELEVDDCKNLEFMFFSSMVKSLARLRDLTVEHCKKMKTIIMVEEGLGMETSETLAFPTLTKLCLKWLKSLTCFSHGKCSREAWSQDVVQPQSIVLFNREAFPNLEELIIKGMDNIELIWDSQVATDSFRNLKSLSVDECNKLKRIWNKELKYQVNVYCLRSIWISSCENLAFLFPASVARDLIQLEELKINECGIVELIEKEVALVPRFDFPKLTSIEFVNLTELRCIYTGINAFQWPALKTLKVHGCNKVEIFASQPENEMALRRLPLFLIKKVSFPRLKTLEIIGLNNLQFIFFPSMVKSLTQLRELTVSKCNKMEAIIAKEEGFGWETSETQAFSMLIDLPLESVMAFNQLKYIKIDELRELRYFSSGGYALVFPILKDIIVNGCPNMEFFSKGLIEAPNLGRVQVVPKKSFGSPEYQNFQEGNLNISIQNMFEEMGTFVGVKEMRLSEFPKLIGKWQSKLNLVKSSWQLKSLVIDKCPFVNAIPPKLMLVLDNLNTLQVHNCELLEEIFNIEGLEAIESTQVLPQLDTLILAYLPKLKQLWNKDLQGMLRFSSLSRLVFYQCSNLRHAFALSMVQCLPSLRWMEIKECDQMEKVIVEEERQGSTMEKIIVPALRWIELECLPNLTNFLSGNNHMLECPRLEDLTIAHCPKLRSLTSGPSLFTPQVQFFGLKRMVLSHMESLSKIWSNDPQEALAFDYLREVEAENCKSLENMFPHWVATSLTQLEELRVESCEIEKIVTSRDDTPHSNTANVLFPKLTSLVLHDLPRLKSFCTNQCTLNWPLLKELRVTHCDKVNMLSFATSMDKGSQKNDQQDLSDQETRSSFEKDFPNLERILLVQENVQMILDGKVPNDIFGKPRALTLACFHDEEVVFPSRFLLERFQNLESLEVFCSSFRDIFPDEGLVDEGKHLALENLRELKLSKLHNLKPVWREDYLVSKILQSIETFEVCDCPSLITLFPYVISFKNLTELVVKNSSGLVHLVTTSAVTDLVHLTDITIIGCERMKEVVTNDENEEMTVVSLEKLQKLTLQHLPSLECFSSTTNCVFKFPYLYKIVVEECPRMKIFSKGTLRTPELRNASLFKCQWQGRWDGDLNATIQSYWHQ